MKRPVIAIGLDAADPQLLETWMAQGHLPHLNQLRQQGAYGRLDNLEYYKAETPWTTFLTGCLPPKTGYWAPVKFFEGTYKVEEIEAYDFQNYPPFYALGKDYRVAVFDVPQSTLSSQVNGPQVLAWGAHSPQTPSHSLPDGLLSEIQQTYGKHPALHRDHGDWWDQNYLQRLKQNLQTGLEMRSQICQDWLKQENWDLFLTIFGETHSAGHDFWYLSQQDHPLYPHKAGSLGSNDPMLEVFESADRALGEILSAAPEDAYIAVFSAHGSGNNTTDVSSMMFLPEFLYRWNFPGEAKLAVGKPGRPVSPPITDPKRKTWTGEIWQRKQESNPLKGWLRRRLPSKYHGSLDHIFGQPAQDLLSPQQLQQEKHSLFWQPTMWYRPYWPQMKAFAIPTYSEGYIRINLQGREPQGIVAPQDYTSTCEEITQALYQLVDARTRQPVVKKVIATRKTGLEQDPRLPDADLVVVWQDQPTDVVESPLVGRIGPVPYRRTGSHRARGFFTLCGPGITPGSLLPTGHAVDLAPTLLSLMGAKIPDYMDGKPLVIPQSSVLTV